VRADRRSGVAGGHRSGCPGLMTPTQLNPSSVHACASNADRRAVLPEEMLGFRQTAHGFVSQFEKQTGSVLSSRMPGSLLGAS
jgi:hypothetical protein